MHTYIDKKLVEALLDAINGNQNAQACALLDELTQLRETELYQQVAQLSQNLHQTLDSLEEDAPILMHAKHDLPDVTERLQYVINETQRASESTLSSTENVLNILDQVKHQVNKTVADGGVGTEKTLSMIEQACSELTNIMMAQSFQDLTGQVLNRVIYIMTDLEGSLKSLIERSKFDLQTLPERIKTDEQRRADEAKGIGPNVTSSAKQDTVASQEDVDDLLSSLGI